MSIFNADFYPTPPEVAATMLDSLDLRGHTANIGSTYAPND